MNKALAIWNAGGIELIVASGGTGRHPPAEAEVMRRLLLAGGVPDHAIVTERQSTSTLTNAAFSAPLLHARGHAQAIVVTDRYHALRSRLAFRRFGIAAEMAAADDAEPRPRRRLVLRGWAREALALPVLVLRLYLGPPVQVSGASPHRRTGPR